MSGLLCRIAAYDFSDDEKSNSDDDQLGPTLAPLTESNGRLASFSGLHLGVASDTSDSELDGDIHNPLYADGSATWVMLTNLVQRCCSSLKTNERVVDYVVESERWVPVPARTKTIGVASTCGPLIGSHLKVPAQRSPPNSRRLNSLLCLVTYSSSVVHYLLQLMC